MGGAGSGKAILNETLLGLLTMETVLVRPQHAIYSGHLR